MAAPPPWLAYPVPPPDGGGGSNDTVPGDGHDAIGGGGGSGAASSDIAVPTAVGTAVPTADAALRPADGTGMAAGAARGDGGLPVDAVLVVYRISSGGYLKRKPPYITKEACLVNMCASLLQLAAAAPDLPLALLLWRDCCTPSLAHFAAAAVTRLLAPRVTVLLRDSEFGDGAASFNAALAAALAFPPPRGVARDRVGVYMVEDDYLHTKEALRTLLGGLALAPYVTAYDHPDKYTPALMGAAHVMAGPCCHWRSVRSTTMTFATRLATLAADADTMREFTGAAPPDDHHMWLALGARGRTLLSPLPGCATHGETAFLSPFVAWDEVGSQAARWMRQLSASLPPLPSAPLPPTAESARSTHAAAVDTSGASFH